MLLLRALETAPPGEVSEGLWSGADAQWASALARQTAPAGASPTTWLAERARHAVQRLVERDPAFAALALLDDKSTPTPVAQWPAAAMWLGAALAFGLGLATQTLAAGESLNLLSPPWLALLVWNLAMYALLLARSFGARSGEAAPRPWLARAVQALAAGRSRLTPRLAQAPWRLRFAAEWAQAGLPASAARTATLLHAGAALLAAGLIAGLYLRGLALDFRAGWQSTFLDAGSVHALLATLLALASVLTGIGVPDAAGMAALRVGPGVAATAPAAPWIHLLAGTLALVVVLPRALLALWSRRQARRAAAAIALPLGEPYFAQLLLQADGRAQRWWLLPHGQPPAGATPRAVRALLEAAWGAQTELGVAAAVPYGSEDSAAVDGAGACLVLCDMAATPEREAQGRLLARVRNAVLLLDRAAFAQRFAGLPARVAEREQAWQRFAAESRVPLVVADLTAAAPGADTVAALRTAAGMLR